MTADFLLPRIGQWLDFYKMNDVPSFRFERVLSFLNGESTYISTGEGVDHDRSSILHLSLHDLGKIHLVGSQSLDSFIIIFSSEFHFIPFCSRGGFPIDEIFMLFEFQIPILCLCFYGFHFYSRRHALSLSPHLPSPTQNA